jgi:hypothetical protein
VVASHVVAFEVTFFASAGIAIYSGVGRSPAITRRPPPG